jgi:hypothetical protein
MAISAYSRKRPGRMLDFSREREVSLHISGHFASAIFEGLKEMRHVNAGESRIASEGGPLSRQIEENRSRGVTAGDAGFHLSQENLLGPELKFETHIRGVDRTEAQAIGSHKSLPTHGVGRRIDHGGHVYALEFSGNIVGFQKNGSGRIGRQKIGRDQLSALDFYLRNLP